jgi:muramoyltetrapeptide carboxypeptidase
MKHGLKVLPITPSSPYDVKAVDAGLAVLDAQGFNIARVSPRREMALAYLNGDDQTRLAELEAALQSDAQLVWLTRGGYGLTRLLPSLRATSGAPLIVGYSDATSLFLHLWHHHRVKSLHGPTLAKVGVENADSLKALWFAIEGRAREIVWPHLEKLYWPKNTSIEGTLIVANLCVMTHLVGTSSMPSLRDCILVVEEVGERPYRIDRMLTQLWNSGSLDGVKAIALGHFTGCDEPGVPTLDAKSVLLERCRSFGIPLCAGLPVGHQSPNWAIPFGVHARLESGNNVQLRILEELV